MSVVIDIPNLKKPSSCIDCPFHFYQEEDEDHFSFYQCIFEHFKESYAKTPMSKTFVKYHVLDSCPIREYNYDGFSCVKDTIKELTNLPFIDNDSSRNNILYRIAVNLAEVADQLAENNGYYMATHD